jgi:outer membrane lipoprotein LolB
MIIVIKHSARLILLFSTLLALFILQGCIATPSIKPVIENPSQNLYQDHLKNIATIQQFSLQGKIGIQTENKGFSGSLNWQHNSTSDNIALFSPLGSQIASIRKTSEQVILEDANGNTVSATDAESLTLNTLGWQLPLTGLADWAIGRPTNSPIQNIQWNEVGQITHLVQDGWDIECDEYAEFLGYSLPNKLYLRSPKVNIKLIVKQRDFTN